MLTSLSLTLTKQRNRNRLKCNNAKGLRGKSLHSILCKGLGNA
jgi:hypothetical protein